MIDITKDLIEGTIIISDSFSISAATNSVDATPYFNNIDDEYIISFTNLEGVSSLTKLTYDTLGTTTTRFLVAFYRVSRDNSTWSDWLEINKTGIDNLPIIDPLDTLYVDLKWIRKGTNTIGAIRLLDYKLEGTIERPITDDNSTFTVAPGDVHIVKSPFIYKIFRIDDLEIISSTGITSDTIIKYRFSQDNSRTWSNWEILTKENISTKRITPTRFFQIEYLIENNSTTSVGIQDINLIGNFQNVTNDYQKTNLYGIRESCQTFLNTTFDEDGNPIPNPNGVGNGSCENPFSPMSLDKQAQLYNPYEQTAALALLNQLSNDATNMFGHKVIYFVTDPDKKGVDYTIHEYQLYNVVEKCDIKVTVPDNNFPDSQIVMNQFDLNLFDSMEAHITKEHFKQTFGVQRRPSKEDFMYFCNLNRLYQVDHAQQFRNFNNSAVYYKLILKKFTQKSNVMAGNTEIKNMMDMLTQNSTINELFGIENQMDKEAVANKPQHKVLTKDPIRLSYKAKIDKELVENSSTVISKSHYDLSSVTLGTGIAVQYFNNDPLLDVSDNIGFTNWFSINNYIEDEVYNFFDYYDNTNMLGWKVNLINDTIKVTLNNDEYVFDLDLLNTDMVGALEEDVWYCYVLNIDQRNRKIYQYLYKRNVDDEDKASRLKSTVLRKLHSNELDMTPIRYELEGINPKILGSDMKITNIRLFTDIITESEHNKILNQYIIGDDSKFLIFGDNANTRLFLPKFPLFE